MKLYNSLTRKVEEFKPINENNVKMYSCGLTVYDKTHLGHGRTYIVVDILYRLLCELYGKNHVLYVRNITDVDDKINKKAVERGISIQEVSLENIKFMNEDFDYLHLLRPNIEPKATEHIKDMIDIIQTLIDRGHAYVAEGHVLFDTSTFKDYGKLSGRNIDDMIAGARVEVAPYKKNPTDFVLWKPSLDIDDKSAMFESPWSIGRPGWHIECSAMSHKYLGNTFDIHCGGNDLKFPHHENEIAQNMCAFPDGSFAKYWFHTGILLINGEKMSKSLNNFITVENLRNKGVKGVTIKYAFLKNHYRTPFDFNMKLIEEAEKNLTDLHSAVKDVEETKNLDDNILEYLSDDLNTSKVLAELHILKNKNPSELKKAMNFLGIYDEIFYNSEKDLSHLDITEEDINRLINERMLAKKNKNYTRADEIRNILNSKGITIKDVPTGTEWLIK